MFVFGCLICVYYCQFVCILFEWYCYFEYELMLMFNSCGQCFIGDYVVYYVDDDFVFVLFNLLYMWLLNVCIDCDVFEVVFVVWFDGDWVWWLVDCCFEYVLLCLLL